MNPKVHIVVPARYASTRLPGKPLADILGIPMIVRVMAQVSASLANDCVAAVDDQRVFDAVENAGYQAVMTAMDHPSGSDRVMEVASLLGWSDDDLVINVQGDEPLIPPAVIDTLLKALQQDTSVQIATMREQITDESQVDDPNVVKVVTDSDQNSLYFSRSPIPFAREGGSAANYFRHVGLYAFRVSALRRITQMGVSELERTEMLEQLRWLENGERIRVVTTDSKLPGGVDTPLDLERVIKVLQAERV